MTENKLKEEIFFRFGPVTRARGCFLYTKKGVRLTDLYQAGGRAVLGWGGGDAFTRLKNVMNRGLTGSFVTEYTPQIHKAVSELLGGKFKVFYSSKKMEGMAFWEPWNPESEKINSSEPVCFLPPLPWTDNIYIVCVPEEKVSSWENKSDFMDLPSPIVAGITRSVYDLIAAIKERQEKDWFIYDQILGLFFERKGPYLYPKMTESEYDDFVLSCLDLGVIINPCCKEHSIVPFGADKGVFTGLKNLNK